ncbi:MAG TPA: helix-turn-helix domain-containing protein [Baekduia sp.]|uniref:PucR family transcriptional regulator n=1 Tax=Baekduia sp. TaxID=2600305 RepID=UPI002C5DEC35|nr:helix-turn-helix domain-containing protein [Baekduia sp.]HMJ35028.1 helix-turn-helix domain-containing protein [Baekduia sp.]
MLLTEEPQLLNVPTSTVAGSDSLLEVIGALAEIGRDIASSTARAEAVGQQLTVALQQADLVERPPARHVARELCDALADGRSAVAEAHARAAGHDLDRLHAVVIVEPPADPGDGWPQAAARVAVALGGAAPGSLCDVGDTRVRALVPLRGPDRALDVERLDGTLDELAREESLAAGRSEPRRGVDPDAARGFTEAACAVRVARAITPGGGARAYGELGVYRYLAALPAGHTPDDRHAAAIATLADYDARRRTELLRTLERHLGDRGALAATARALYIHTNTLRQRLDRIEQLTGLALAEEDLLSLELALKLARLQVGADANA